MDERAVERVLAVKRRVEDELLKIPGVHGVSVAPRRVGGRETGELAIRVHVAAKTPPDRVPAGELIPPEINGVATDVVQDEPLRPF
jgi:hypothetical protein